MKNILAGVLQGFMLGPLQFLIYIHDLSNEIEYMWKILAGNTSLFSIVKL